MIPNIINPNIPRIIPSYVGVAIPACINRQPNPLRQQFANRKKIRIVQQIWYNIQKKRSQYVKNKKLTQNFKNKVQDYFELLTIYWKPRYVVLFTKNDEDKDPVSNGTILKMWLNGAKRLNLDPTRPGEAAYDTILEAIKKREIILDWDALVQIFHAKMLNINNKHVNKYITGLGYINPIYYKSNGTHKEFGRPTWNLTQKGETIKNLFALQFLGFAVNLLLTTQPQSIMKRRYRLHEYLKKVIFGSSQNSNELFYTINYISKFQFAVTSNREVNSTMQ